MKYALFILLCCFFIQFGKSQSLKLTGRVVDENQNPLSGSHVHHGNTCYITDENGEFEIQGIENDTIHLNITFIGYRDRHLLFQLPQKKIKIIQLEPEILSLAEVSVKVESADSINTREVISIDKDFLSRNTSSRFIKALDNVSGINSMDIGANASKPVIRGMAFTRVVVSEDGVKQEGQQWGADHGLEIDPFAVEKAKIVKGASAIEYGSDAIGGYIDVSGSAAPGVHSLSGEIKTLAKSINNTLGASLNLQGRTHKLYFKIRGTALQSGDYRIPTDTIVYLNRKMPVNGRLKNSAGEEYDLHFRGGYVSEKLSSSILISNVSQTSGFFPGAHGAPDLDRLVNDGDNRNIDFPYQEVSHFKIISNTFFDFSASELNLDLGYQDNLRREWSLFHTHYPGQEPPEEGKEKGNLELGFRLKTYTANAKFKNKGYGKNQWSTGIQSAYKQNDIEGYNFLLPQYNSYSGGLFVTDAINVNNRLKINLGIRYDYSFMETESFFDEVVFSYFRSRGRSEDESNSYAERATALNREFHDYSFLAGLIFNATRDIQLKLNIGKVFRYPTAIELSSNGIHHGSFRHEKGDPTLESEKGYYADMNLGLNFGSFDISFSPYSYYFLNFIFLNPTGEWSELPHAGQLYQYEQTKALVAGLETSVHGQVFPKLEFTGNLEFIYNRQLNEDPSLRYPLPFTPPINGFAELRYNFGSGLLIRNGFDLILNTRFAANQNRIARNEDSTPGYFIVGTGISGSLFPGNMQINLSLTANNIFNRKYYNHISFTRKLQIPEQGRNIQLLVSIPFTIN